MISLPPLPEAEARQQRDQSRRRSDRYRSADLWPYVDLLWQRRRMIVGITLGAAVIATLTTLLMPRQYRAEATVFLTPPTYATTLRPTVMSVEAYARLAETEHMLSLVDNELKSTHTHLFQGAQEGQADLHVTYAARLSASREPQKPYLPLIGLTAAAETPEKARVAANTWADVFITEEGKISAAGKSNSANFILREYPKVEQVLVESENGLRGLLARQAQELAALKTELGVPLKRAQLESYEFLVVQQEDAIASAVTRRDRLAPSVAQLEKELKATPQYLVVNKAITDDALWRAQSENPAGTDALAKARLQSQEVNPVHVTLSQRLAEDRVNLNALGPQIESLQKQVESTRKLTVDLRRALLDGERRIAEMERRHEVEAGGAQRAVDTSRAAFEKLAEKIREARLAQSEPDSDLKLGAYAGLPSKPSGPRRSVIVAGTSIAAFVVTALALLFVGLFKGHQRELQNGPRDTHS